MGDVIIVMKVMPESPEIDLKALAASIREVVPETKDIQEEPIGFGLSSLKVLVVVPDSEGATDKVEESIRGLKDVASAEITDVTLE